MVLIAHLAPATVILLALSRKRCSAAASAPCLSRGLPPDEPLRRRAFRTDRAAGIRFDQPGRGPRQIHGDRRRRCQAFRCGCPLLYDRASSRSRRFCFRKPLDRVLTALYCSLRCPCLPGLPRPACHPAAARWTICWLLQYLTKSDCRPRDGSRSRRACCSLPS